MKYQVHKTYIINIYRNEEFYQCKKKSLKVGENLTTNSQANFISAQIVEHSQTINTPVKNVVGEQTDCSKH